METFECTLRDSEKDLGSRLKGYEREFETVIDPNMHLVVRIDGHKFSKYTEGFVKPFDKVLSKAMELTTIDLLEKFSAYCAYTQSDEITLIIPSLKDRSIDNRASTDHKLDKRIRKDWEHFFGGRVQKTVSLISAYTTMRFNIHMHELLPRIGFDYPWEYGITHENVNKQHNMWLEYLNLIQYKKLGNAWFDCRVYGVLDDAEAFNSVMWRVRDAEKNSRSMFAQAYCSHKELQKLTGEEQVQYCLEKTGKNWVEVEDRYKYGILVKREQYEGEGLNPKTQQKVKTIRTRTVTWSERLTRYSEGSKNLVMAQFKESV